MRAVLLGGVLLLAALAGCIGSDDEDPSGEGGSNGNNNTPAPTETDGGGGGGKEKQRVSYNLDNLTTCDFEYPSGGAIPCENQFTEIAVESRERPSFATDQEICVYREQWRDPDIEKWVFWDPAEDSFAIYYEAALPEGASGVHGMIYQESTGVKVNWYDGPASGYVAVPNLIDGETYTILLYAHEYESNTPALEDGSIRALWSDPGTPYPLQVVSANQDYYLNNVTMSESNDNTYYKLDPVDLSGPDFNISVTQTTYVDFISTSFDRGHRLGCALV